MHPQRSSETAKRSSTSQLYACGRLIALLLAIVAVGLLATDDLLAYRAQMRGIESGGDDALPALESPRLGLNVALERYEHPDDLAAALDEIAALGYRLVRQRVSWAVVEPTAGDQRWDAWDRIIEAAAAHDLRLLVYVNDAPEWARRHWERENPWAPPEDPALYGRFVGSLAQRYGHVIAAYQIWDQPNIHPYWGDGAVDPAAYVALLKEASGAIRAADPGAVVIAGGLAPTNEDSGRNLSDLRYLQELHRLGAAPLYDVLGVRLFGFWTGPSDRRVAPEALNYSRAVLLREELVRRGLSSLAVWAIDGGWCALPQDWPGRPSATGSDTPLVQNQRLSLAVERMRQEWPWLTWAALGHWQPDAAVDDPLWGYALHLPSGERQPLHATLAEIMQEQPVLYPGITRTLEELEPTQSQDRTDLAFWGTHLWLLPGEGSLAGSLHARVDVQHTAQEITFPMAEDATRIAVGRPVPLGRHTTYIEGDPMLLQSLGGFQVAARRPIWPPVRAGVLGLGTVTWLAVLAWQELRIIRWRQAWCRAMSVWQRLPKSARLVALLGALAGATALDRSWVVLACLMTATIIALLDLQSALLAAVLAIPLAPVALRLGNLRFSVAEITVLLALGARLGEALVAQRFPLPKRPCVGWQRVADVGVLGLVMAGLVSASFAEFQRVAWREVRLCLLEPALLYYLLRSNDDAETRQMMAPALLAGGALMAGYALLRYPAAAGVIEAEGVRRARGFYGSPNNLALIAERIVPLALALALWGEGRIRRTAASGVAILLLLATLLTFSRGSLLIGLPLGLIALGLLHGGRWRWLAAGGAAGGLLLALLLLGGQRLASLVDLSQGTAFLRIQLWRSAVHMIADHTWIGVGPDGFLYYYGDYIRAGAEVERWLSHPHNLVLAAWTRLGLPGLLAMLTLVAGGIGMAARRRGGRSPLLIGLGAGLVAALAHGMVDSFFFVPELALWLMATIALLGGLQRDL